MAKSKKQTVYVTGRGWVTRTVPKKRAKSGACKLTVQGVRPGATFYEEEMQFPVSWRGRDAAGRAVKRKGYRHAVLAIQCPSGKITLASCSQGKCEVLSSGSPRQERKHRGKALYSRPIAGF